MKSNRFPVVLAVAVALMAIVALSSFAHAAMYTTTIGGDTFTIVEADPFKSGDTAGNTVRAVSPGTPWASTSTSNSDGLWRERAIVAFTTGYESNGGATDRTYELGSGDRTNGPELATSVSGLAPTPFGYDVYSVYITRNDSPNAGVLSDLNAPATTLHHRTNREYTLNAGSGVWDVALSLLGTTDGGNTSFTINTKGTSSVERNDYIGVAYKPSSTPPAGARVQFKQSASANDQAGWTQIVGGAPPLSDTISGGEFDGLVVTGNGTHVRSHTHDTDYRIVNHSDGHLDSLLSGGILTNATDSNITLELAGLADGEYAITTYHHTPYSRTNGAEFDVLLTDAVVTDSLIHDNVSMSYGDTVTTAELAALVTEFEVSGGSTTTLTFVPGAGFDGGGGDHLNINGFELRSTAVIPEPPTFALAALGLLGLGFFGRWRRRR